MTAPEPGGARPKAVLAERVADAVRDHPAVARLSGGAFGTVSSHLPGRRVLGVRAGGPGEPVEIAVVVRFGHPLPQVVAELRERVRQLAGDVPVDVDVVDLVVEGRNPGESAG